MSLELDICEKVACQVMDILKENFVCDGVDTDKYVFKTLEIVD